MMDDNEIRSYFRPPTPEDMERVEASMREYEYRAKFVAEARLYRIVDLIKDHSPYIARQGNTACRNGSCTFEGVSVGAHYKHLAELVIADVESDAYPNHCPYDCDSCHDDECPCGRLGCAGSEAPGAK